MATPPQSIEAQVARLKAAVAAFERELLGPVGAPVPAPAAPSRPRVYLPDIEFKPVELGARPASMILPVRTISYSSIQPVQAPKPVDAQGEEYDAGDYFDAWILVSTVPIQVAWDGQPAQNCPSVPANSSMNFPIHARKVYYRAANPTGPQGTLNLWLAKY